MSEKVIPIAEAKALVVSILEAHNTSSANAASVANALVSAEIDGQRGHGLSRVPSYAAQAASGKVDGQARPRIIGQRPGALRIDAAQGFAFPAFDLVIDTLPPLARDCGVAAASLFHSHHFGQAGYHAERLAQQGLLALVVGNSPQAIAPWGGHKGLFGTNPIAFAAPRTENEPLLIDLSLSKVARGKVMVASQRGESIPEGWALDRVGNPTTDPDAALEGTMLPMGDAKGAALVLVVEILAAALGGANFGYEASSFFSADGPPPGVGQLVIAFDPDFFSGNGFADRLEALIGEILAQQNARLPGSNRAQLRRTAADQGLRVPSQLLDELTALAEL